MSALTAGVAEFSVAPPPIPVAARQVAKNGIIDAVGLMLGARCDPVVKAVREAMSEDASTPGGSSVLLSTPLATSTHAAMVNAAAIHAHAMDDVAWGCHPSAVLLPAILAEAETIHASGRAVLDAWVVGYEVMAELVSRERGSLNATNWHPTGFICTVAAAAAVSHLLGHCADVARRAMSIAASFGGGLTANFGTQTKALHAGRAASSSLQAVKFAQAGITASADALERSNGLLKALSPEGDVDIGSPCDPARPAWRVLEGGLCIKQYPLCYTVHRVVDAAIALSGREGLRIADISRIEVSIGSKQAALALHRQPRDVLQAKYSVEFAVACGLVARAASLEQLKPEFIQSPDVQRLMKLTRRELLDEQSPEEPLFAPCDRVRVFLADGSCFDSGDIAYPLGHARNPLDESSRRKKFLEGAKAGQAKAPLELYALLCRLETLDDINRIRG